MMGCGSSSTSSAETPRSPLSVSTTFRSNRSNTPSETIVQAFQRLDEDISNIESISPGSRLTTAEAWIEYLETSSITVDDAVQGILNNNPSNMSATTFNDSKSDETIMDEIIIHENKLDSDKADIAKVRRLAVKLGVAFDADKSMKQEEFLAKVSRGSMEIEAATLRHDMIEHAKKRVNLLTETYNNLRDLYSEQDNLIATISGGTYSTNFEQKLDLELEMMREIRDRLGGVSEQWRTAGNLLRASAKGGLAAYECWSLVGQSKDAEERVNLALDARSACHSSLAALEGSQQALPQVEIPFISLRQASAVRHAIIYLLTDMANEARYRHTKEVLEAYQLNTAKAVEWLHDTFQKTLSKDFEDANANVIELVKKLRQERVKNFSSKVGKKIYNPPILNMNV